MKPYYEDDAVVIYHADCRDFCPPADVLVTDPPYGIKAESKKGTYRGAGSQKRRVAPIHGDKDTAVRDAALRIWGHRPAVVFGSWRATRPPAVRSLLIWHKEGSYSGPANAAFFTNHEEIYILGSDAAWRRSSSPLRSVITTTETRHHEVARNGHPTSKPVQLMVTLLDRCPPGSTIADPFAGSGSTLLAAKALGRRAIGVEIDERYCAAAAARLAQGVLDFGAGGAA